MTLARSGGHRWQSAVGNSPFLGEGRAPRRPPVRRGTLSVSLRRGVTDNQGRDSGLIIRIIRSACEWVIFVEFFDQTLI